MQEYKVVVNDSGHRRWYIHDCLHREDGPAVEYPNGDRYWYIHGQVHREDGPAIEHANGDRFWFRKGRPHREDGPAVEKADGSREWYLNGNCLTEAEFLDRMKPAPRELTVAEIEALLGYSVKVVK